MNAGPTIATVLCFPGSRWKLEQRTLLHDHPLRTMRLPKAPAERKEL
jgi:hypothetical protein